MRINQIPLLRIQQTLHAMKETNCDRNHNQSILIETSDLKTIQTSPTNAITVICITIAICIRLR